MRVIIPSPFLPNTAERSHDIVFEVGKDTDTTFSDSSLWTKLMETVDKQRPDDLREHSESQKITIIGELQPEDIEAKIAWLQEFQAQCDKALVFTLGVIELQEQPELEHQPKKKKISA